MPTGSVAITVLVAVSITVAVEVRDIRDLREALRAAEKTCDDKGRDRAQPGNAKLHGILPNGKSDSLRPICATFEQYYPWEEGAIAIV